MIFQYERTIYLRETDAMGTLFFTELPNIALETFEAFFQSKEISLSQWMEEEGCVFPIVHAECDFTKPLRAHDRIQVDLALEKVGRSSFTLRATFYRFPEMEEVGSTRIVHVATSNRSGTSLPIPDALLREFGKLPV